MITDILNKQQHSHFFALLWWLVLLLFCFGFYIVWDFGFVEPVFSNDRSHLTKAIAVLTIAASLHAAWHIIRYSIYLKQADHKRNSQTDELTRQNLSLEILADRLRAPVEAGWFMVDLAIRLGLAGTIIGFILIFSSLTGESIVGDDALQQLLVSMSVGMGTALFTTLCGLIAATFLSIQYMVLSRQTEHVIAAYILATDI